MMLEFVFFFRLPTFIHDTFVITGQLAVVQFEAVEGAGAKQKHVLL